LQEFIESSISFFALVSGVLIVGITGVSDGIIEENKSKEYVEFYCGVLMGEGKKDRGLLG
ncbi:hypothetical protein OMAG_002770, partial [Candidatus Omnitrophus magneticus]